MITYVNVPAENQEEFINIETEYWAESKQANIDAGNQIAWGLVQKVGEILIILGHMHLSMFMKMQSK